MDAERLIDDAVKFLRRHKENFDSPREIWDQAVEMLQHALGRDFEWEEEIRAPIVKKFNRMVARRSTGEPLTYILGYTEFMDLKLKVRRGGFIPRATTEHLCNEAIARLNAVRKPIAVDAACGIGPIALALAHHVRAATVYGTDISTSALTQARANAKALGLKNVSFRKGSMLDPLPRAIKGSIDVIAAHPPYVSREDVEDLPPELKDFEPVESLTDSEDGFHLIKVLVDQATEWLHPDGWIMMEVGTYIARPVRSILTGARFRDVRSLKGDMPYTRVLVGHPPA